MEASVFDTDTRRNHHRSSPGTRKHKVAPTPLGLPPMNQDDVVQSTLKQWAGKLAPNDTRVNQSDAVMELLLQREDNPNSTAIALDLVTNIMHKYLPSSPVADAVVNTLIHSIYADYDPRKSILDQTRHRDKARESLVHIKPPTPIQSTELDFEQLAQQWNKLVLEQTHRQSADDSFVPPAHCLASCIDALPLQVQCDLAMLLAQKFESMDEFKPDVEEDPDPGELFDDMTLEDDDEELNINHYQAVTAELESIHRLLYIEDRRAQAQARRRLQLLLVQSFGSQDEHACDARVIDVDYRRQIHDLTVENPSLFIDLGLY